MPLITIRHDHYFHPSEDTQSVLAVLHDLKGIIMAANQATIDALTEIKTNLTEAGAEFDAKLTELANAIAGNTSPEADALIEDLRAMSRALADKVPNPPAAGEGTEG
jgi:hypothetical protein